jgi:dynein regulatory complex protein 1
MQILEKCMEDMKAVYHLNEEKLDFNTKVLNERNTENIKTKERLKVRVRNYLKVVRDIKQKHKEELLQY